MPSSTIKKKKSLNPVPQNTNNKSFSRINIKSKKFVAFSYDVFISHMPLWLDHSEYDSGCIRGRSL